VSDNGTKEFEFQCRVVRCIYDTEDYRVYAVDVDKDKYNFIKFTKYGTAVISGNLHQLGEGILYSVKATEEITKNGYGYKVNNIKRDRPNTSLDMQLFLQEILTPMQADTLFKVYPDIVDRVINNRLEDIDLSLTKGIKEYTFERIKEKIVENFALVELVSEFQGLLSLNMVKKLYDKYPSTEKIRYEMKNNPYKCLCVISGIGFKKADGLLLEIEKASIENVSKGLKPIIDFNSDLKTSKQRCLSCILFLLEENENNGHTKMDLVDLKNQCDKLVPACAYHFIDAVKEESIYYDKSSRNVALKETYNTELYIAKNISYGLSVKNEWNINVEKYRNSSEFSLTDEQLQSINYLCKYNISILNGFGGSGKSSCTQAIIQMLDDNNKSYVLLSPTGKAAKVLKEYCKRETSTIHRGLAYIPPNTWTYCMNNKLDSDVVVIDEFSMTDIFLFKHVIDAIDFNRTKLLMVGDSAQIPSVACGNLLHDFMQSKVIPTTSLTKIFRYGKGGLMTVATDVRNCKKYLSDSLSQCTYFGDNKDYAFINVDDKQSVKNVLALYEKLLSQNYKVEDIQVLTAYNKGEYGTVVLNNHLQKIANKNFGSDTFLKYGEITYYVGDLIIQKQNNYKAKVYIDDDFCIDDENLNTTFIANGECGIVLSINRYEMVIDFDGIRVSYSREDLQSVGLGYAISIHKSQGSSSKVIILLTPKSHTYMLNSNLIYVGLTRMKERCFHIGAASTVNTSIKKKENFNRMTFMQSMLIENAK
jgi:exodeoxyribonuclease V alpha subunit